MDLTPAVAAAPFASPLMLADRLITLAQEADRSGFRDAAVRLIKLVDTVLDEGRH